LLSILDCFLHVRREERHARTSLRAHCEVCNFK
jgi:hypothetical protein